MKKQNGPQFTGIWIPRALWFSNLTMRQKLIVAQIDGLCAEVGYCYASNKHLTEFFKVQERMLQRDLKVLIDEGWITRETKYSDGKTDRKIYSRMLRKASEMTGGGVTSVGEGVSPVSDIKQSIKTKEKAGNSAPTERQQAAPPVPKQKDTTNHPYRFFEIINEHRSEPMAATAKEMGQCKNLVKYANKDEDTLRRKIQLYQADRFWGTIPVTASTLAKAWNGLEGKVPGEKSGWAAKFDEKMNGES